MFTGRIGVGRIQEDRCGINTGGSVRDVYRRIGPSRIQEDRCGTYTGGLVRDVYRRTGVGRIQGWTSWSINAAGEAHQPRDN